MRRDTPDEWRDFIYGDRRRGQRRHNSIGRRSDDARDERRRKRIRFWVEMAKHVAWSIAVLLISLDVDVKRFLPMF